MNKVEQIVEKFGGQSALAKLIGKRQSVVGYWCQSGSIPSKWHAKLILIAKENGISLSTEEFLFNSEGVLPKESKNLSYKDIYATNFGYLSIGKTEIPCAVLNNRKRVVVQREVVGLLTGNIKGGLERYLNADNLRPYLPIKFQGKTMEQIAIIFKHKNKVAHGFEGEDLIDICSMYLNARKADALYDSQLHLAEKAEIIISAFAKLGITAAIDEVTGFSKEKDEYQNLLKKYIAEELQPWIKTFGDDYYREIYRLKNWNFDRYLIEGKNHPWEVARITNRIIYEKLPDGVLEELKKKSPVNEKGYRKNRYFRFLTPHTGYVHLLKHLGYIQAILEKFPSGSWSQALHEIDKKFMSYRDPFTHKDQLRLKLDQP